MRQTGGPLFVQYLRLGLSLLAIFIVYPASLWADEEIRVLSDCDMQDSGYGEVCDDDWYGEETQSPENIIETKYANGRMAFLFGQYEIAFKAWKPLADIGYSKAQASLAWMYHTGNGVEKNLDKALELYRKAADQGHSIAQNNLGVFYEKGLNVPKNEKTAALWYRKAAEVGYSYAQYNLATLYAEGRGVNQDLEQAKYWLLIASRQGVTYATDALKQLEEAPPVITSQDPKPAVAHAPFHSNPVTKGLAWIDKQDQHHYTIQLARSKDMDWILKLASASRLDQPMIQFSSMSKGEEWHNLIYGSFPTKEAAEAAAKTLSEAMRKWTPWVRPFAEVREQMLKPKSGD